MWAWSWFLLGGCAYVSLSYSAGTNTPAQVGDGNSRLSTSSGAQTGWNQKADDWDSWDTTRLPSHQPIRGRSYTLQPHPPNVAYENSSWKTIEEFRSSEHEQPHSPCNKPFSAPNYDVSVCLAHELGSTTHSVLLSVQGEPHLSMPWTLMDASCLTTWENSLPGHLDGPWRPGERRCEDEKVPLHPYLTLTWDTTEPAQDPHCCITIL